MTTEKKQSSKPMLKVTCIHTTIRRPKVQSEWLRGLGLTRLYQTKILEDNVVVRGLLTKAAHLVRVEKV